MALPERPGTLGSVDEMHLHCFWLRERSTEDHCVSNSRVRTVALAARDRLVVAAETAAPADLPVNHCSNASAAPGKVATAATAVKAVSAAEGVTAVEGA